MSAWHSLYIPDQHVDSVQSAFDMALVRLGYARYNPFGVMPTKPYKQTVRLFISPTQNDWTRIIGEAPPEVCREASSAVPILRMSLQAHEFVTDGWESQEALDLKRWIHRHKPDVDVGLLNTVPLPPRIAEQRPPVVPLSALPEDVQRMAQRIDSAQAAKMFERISSDLLKKAGGDSAAAQALLQGHGAPDWNSSGGRHIQQAAQALALGEGWREPDFVTLRDAYQAASRRKRRPDAPPLPGDTEALAAVPNALDYIPVFAGKDA